MMDRNKPKISYDREFDILWYHAGKRKSTCSQIADFDSDIIIDIDEKRDNEIVGIEIHGFKRKFKSVLMG